MKLDKNDDTFDDSDLDMDMNNDNDYLNNDMGMFDFSGSNVDSPLSKHKDLLKGLTDFDPYLRESFNHWLGVTWDEENQTFKANPGIKPILSLQGAAWCITFLKTYARGNNIITHINQDDYIAFCEDMIDTIYKNLGTNDILGANSQPISDGDLIMLANQLIHTAELILMGAGEGKYNKFLSTTYSFSGNSNFGNAGNNGYNNPQQLRQEPPKKEGFFNRILKRL